MLADDLVDVRILGVPLELWARAQEHIDGLLREFTLLVSGAGTGLSPPVPARLLALVDKLERDYAAMTSEQEQQLIAASAAGTQAIDLTYRVPAHAADDAAALQSALSAADEFCRSGEHLLTVVTPPDALAFRQWYLGEFIRQIAGEPPRPWSG